MNVWTHLLCVECWEKRARFVARVVPGCVREAAAAKGVQLSPIQEEQAIARAIELTHYGKPPIVLEGMTAAPCCACGQSTSSGIYVREDPAGMACEGRRGEHDEATTSREAGSHAARARG